MNDKPIEAETVPEPSGALTVRHAQAVGEALGVEQIIAQVKLIQTVMAKVMHEGEHYGKIPGCGDKATLLQPGAQKLTMTFRLAPEYAIQETNFDRMHKEYRVICTLKSMATGNFVGQGVGCCSTLESKYRYRGGARKCPKCQAEAIIMGKKFKPSDPEPGWLCWKKKGGCGATWPVGAPEIENQSVEKVENENPADCYNTVLKIAKKRAFVDATITATAASDIFTQDIGDDENEPGSPPPEGSAPKPQAPAKPSAPAKPASAPAKPARKLATVETRKYMIETLKAGPTEANRDVVTNYFRALKWLPSNWLLEDLPFCYVPVSQAEIRELGSKIAIFGQGDRAEPAYTPSEEKTAAPKDDEAWRDVVVTVPHKGEKRIEYMKNPDTIGSLFELRHDDTADGEDARRRLWGLVENYEPKGWEKRDGTKMPPNAEDIKLREGLDQFADWFAKHHPGEKL